MAKAKAADEEQKQSPDGENKEQAQDQAKVIELEGRIKELDQQVTALEGEKTQLVAQNESLKQSNELLATEKGDLTAKLFVASCAADQLTALAINNGLKIIVNDDGQTINTDKQTPEVSELETKPAPVQMPANEQTLHEQRLKRHGEGYVVANKGKLETVFSAKAWQNLGGDKAGWKQVINTPPEVKALDEKKGGK